MSMLIIYDSVPDFAPFMKKEGIKIYSTFKKIYFFKKIARKIALKFNIGVAYWYDDWKKELDKVDTIIVFATHRIDHIQYIKKHNLNIRLILWYWNPAIKMVNPMKVPKELCEMWSYDPVDCKEYGLKFNSTFYFKNVEIKEVFKDIDLLFLGIDKGRKKILFELNNVMIENSVKTFFHVVPDKKDSKTDYIKPISYKEYLCLISRSKCILDLVPDGNNGMTLRPMEALFFKRKLVTNFIAIKNEPFYDPENIFILGIDDFSTIKQFIDSEYKEIDDKVVKEYEFKNWLSNFL
ncbi:hypothetical protein AB674_04580 [Flavobacterium sp. ABG]|nr:hypothetical protein AB674_04580 [Flavobacterium sp. ABG]